MKKKVEDADWDTKEALKYGCTVGPVAVYLFLCSVTKLFPSGAGSEYIVYVSSAVASVFGTACMLSLWRPKGLEWSLVVAYFLGYIFALVVATAFARAV